LLKDYSKIKTSTGGKPLKGRKNTIERLKHSKNHEKPSIGGLN